MYTGVARWLQTDLKFFLIIAACCCGVHRDVSTMPMKSTNDLSGLATEGVSARLPTRSQYISMKLLARVSYCNVLQ